MVEYARGHRKRLRERLAAASHALADYEVLELVLGHVLLRQDTKPLAKELLLRFGSLRGALDARTPELASVPGFGPALEAYWQLLRELMARYAEAPARRRQELCSPQAVARMARVRLAGSGREEFWVAYLDVQNRLIAWELAAKGSVEAVPLHPRDVMARALALEASGLILVHNHPGGNPRPSGADIDLTAVMRSAGEPLGIRVTDHVIVTDGACYSLAEDRVLPPER
ncbi:MAG: DNA repair protein RadC [Deltaproteobacteria bacterium]|jgi:DNA repair protein RadC|nr:DNA repair protein RadC [Deltaproteobacteria bacterium]